MLHIFNFFTIKNLSFYIILN